MADTNMNYCTQCQNHCPENALKCGKGRRLFGQDQGEDHAYEHGEGHGYGEGCEYGRGEGRYGHEHGEDHEHEEGRYGRKRGEGHGHGEGRRHGHEHGEGHEHSHECGEGREHGHGEEHGHCGHGHGEGRGRQFADDLYGRMRACGHYLYHGFGRGAGQGKILSILSERESMTQKEMQDMLQIQPGSMSEILAKLEEKGLLLRRKDDEDKRRSILTLTDAGREAAKERQGEKKPLFDALDEAEQEELKRLLGKLLDSWK